MPIDYSKWDAFEISDDSDVEESRPTVSAKPDPVRKESLSPGKTKSVASKSGSSATSIGKKVVAGKRAVRLPVEIWLRIFYFNAHPVHLWNDGRRVCKLWRSWIPKIFAEKYIQNPKMVSIQYELGTVQTGDRFNRLALVMSFDRFDPADRERCVFTQDKAYSSRGVNTPEAQKARFTWWAEAINEYLGDKSTPGGRPDLPPHVIMLKSRANDTALPGLQVDTEKREISFEWYGMLGAHLREAAEYESRNAKGASGNASKVLIQAQRLMATEPERAMKMLISVYESNINVRKQVRRERLSKQLRGWTGLNFENDTFKKREAHALQVIADRESEADLTETAEDANQLKEARETQKNLPGASDEAEQDLLMLRALGSEQDYVHDRASLSAAVRLPNFVDLVRWWTTTVRREIEHAMDVSMLVGEADHHLAFTTDSSAVFSRAETPQRCVGLQCSTHHQETFSPCHISSARIEPHDFHICAVNPQ